jgi:hypothetical protein
MTTATRPPRQAYMPGHPHNCNCFDCCELSSAWARNRHREIAYGTWKPFVDATPLHEHIAGLRAGGMADVHIADQLGVTKRRITVLMATEYVRPETITRVLAIRPNVNLLADRADYPARGAARRTLALRAHGWTARELSRRWSLSTRAIARIPQHDLIFAGNHRTIAQFFDDFHDEDPTRHGVPALSAKRARATARRERWAPASAWTDIDHDDKPKPRPWRIVFAKPNPGERSCEVIEETAHLAGFGCTREEIATRMGIEWNSIVITHDRAGEELPLSVRFAPERDGG